MCMCRTYNLRRTTWCGLSLQSQTVQIYKTNQQTSFKNNLHQGIVSIVIKHRLKNASNNLKKWSESTSFQKVTPVENLKKKQHHWTISTGTLCIPCWSVTHPKCNTNQYNIQTFGIIWKERNPKRSDVKIVTWSPDMRSPRLFKALRAMRNQVFTWLIFLCRKHKA